MEAGPASSFSPYKFIDGYGVDKIGLFSSGANLYFVVIGFLISFAPQHHFVDYIKHSMNNSWVSLRKGTPGLSRLSRKNAIFLLKTINHQGLLPVLYHPRRPKVRE